MKYVGDKMSTQEIIDLFVALVKKILAFIAKSEGYDFGAEDDAVITF